MEGLERKPLSVLGHPLVAVAVIIAAGLSLVGGLILFCQRRLRRSDARQVKEAGSAVLNQRPINNLESQTH